MAKRKTCRLLLWCAAAASAGANAAQDNVLLLLQTSGGDVAQSLIDGIDASLAAAPEGPALFIEPFDSNRFPEPAHEAAVAAFLRAKYASRPIDLAIVMGPAALEFFARNGPALFPDAPLVFGGLREDTVLRLALPRAATGIVSRFDIAGTLNLALALQPGAREVVFVSGAAPLDRSWSEHAASQIGAYDGRVTPRFLDARPVAALLDDVASLPPDTIVIYLSVLDDGAGSVFGRATTVLERIVRVSPAPVYGVYESYFDAGIVGGDVLSFERLGRDTGALALEILTGRDAGTIPVRETSNQLVVDAHALGAWNLDAARLPAGTAIVNRDPGLWDRYRFAILTVTTLVVVQALLIVMLLLRTRHRRTERALRETEDRYRNVVETQTDLICRYLPDTTLTFVNDAYCRYFGRSREALVGTQFLELVPTKDRAPVLEKVRSLLAEPRTETYTHQAVRPDGSLSWQQWIDHVVVDDRGAVVEIQGIGRDITGQKLAEIEAGQHREQMAHLTRVAILGELSGALAHELNQPLTAILSNAQAAERLLARGQLEASEMRGILRDIVADDIRAGEVIARLRALLKRGAIERQALEINAVARDVVALMHGSLLERHVECTTRLAPALPAVFGDRVQLQQVLLNLVMNGCEAVGANAIGDRRLTIVTDLNSLDYVVISVADNGAGLSAEAGDRLFEPFYTTKDQGLGLGLSICRSIVAAHGGHLSARNNPDRGATVAFTLPADGGPDPEPLPPARR